MQTAANPTEVAECGCCGHLHEASFQGDCRTDSERFVFSDLNHRFGINGWIVVDDRFA